MTAPRQPAIERIPEILEALFNLERELTTELLSQLASCTLDDLSKLFGCAPQVPPVAKAVYADELPALPPRKQLTEAERVRENYEHSRWDKEGYRVWPEKNTSAFPRQRYERERTRGATHLVRLRLSPNPGLGSACTTSYTLPKLRGAAQFILCPGQGLKWSPRARRRHAQMARDT